MPFTVAWELVQRVVDPGQSRVISVTTRGYQFPTGGGGVHPSVVGFHAKLIVYTMATPEQSLYARNSTRVVQLLRHW